MECWAVDQLRTGDVLLSQGNFYLSRLMAWNAECPYSHAAIMVGRETFAEAAPPAVRCREVAELLASPDRVRFVDVWRPVNPDGSELGPAQRRRIAALAARWSGWPFARAKMRWLALQTLLQHKLGRPQWQVPAPRDDVGFSCTEFVYRVLREAMPVQIGPRRRRPAPFPGLRPGLLRRDWLAWRDWQRRDGLAGGPAQPTTTMDPAPAVTASTAYGPRPTLEAAASVDPRAVITVDLCSSASLRRCGRLALPAAMGAVAGTWTEVPA